MVAAILEKAGQRDQPVHMTEVNYAEVQYTIRLKDGQAAFQCRGRERAWGIPLQDLAATSRYLGPFPSTWLTVHRPCALFGMNHQSCRKRDDVLAALGQNARKRCQERELTQEKLAGMAGLDPTYLSGVERGLRNPGINNVARLAKALSLTNAKLCKGVAARPGNPNPVGLRWPAAVNCRPARNARRKMGRRSSTTLPRRVISLLRFGERAGERWPPCASLTSSSPSSTSTLATSRPPSCRSR